MFRVSPLLVLLAALGCKPTPTVEPDIPTRDFAHKKVEVEAESAPVKPHACRVFVNDNYGTHDVRVDETGKISVTSGGELVVPNGDGYVTAWWPRSYGGHYAHDRLRTRVYELPDPTDPENVPGEWTDMTEWAGGERFELEFSSDEMLLECVDRLEVLAMDEDVAEEEGAYEELEHSWCNEERYIDLSMEVTATLGPWVSFIEQGTSQFEPWRENSYFEVTTVDLVGHELDPIDLIGDADKAAMREAYGERMREQAFSELVDAGLDEPEADKELEGSAESYASDWSEDEMAFTFGGDWVETISADVYESDYRGEQDFEYAGSIDNPHPALLGHLPRDISAWAGDGEVHHGWEEPGCVSVDFADRRVLSHSGQKAELALQGQIVGVYFVPVDLPFSTDLLEARELPRITEPTTVADARAAVKAKDYPKAIRLFEAVMRQDQKAKLEGELCWTYFLNGQLDEAESMCLDAMIYAESKRKLGAIAYNLGRIAEARDDLPTALSFYETSVELRPNKVVRKRRDKLLDEI